MNQKGQSLTAGNLQMYLDSATNATDLGGQQFFTPREYAELFTLALNDVHGVALDMNMGSGNLLLGLPSDLEKTTVRLGVDIDERVRKPSGAEGVWQTAMADVTRLYPLWCDVDFTADTIVVNPPFSLRWHSDRLKDLENSTVYMVREVAREKLKKPTIDSTLATFMMALDRLSVRGEGYMVCNENTARKFFGDPDATSIDPTLPTARLRNHIWLWLTVPSSFFENVVTEMPVAVLYFARSHHSPAPAHMTATDASPMAIRNCLSIAAAQRRWLRSGSCLYQGDGNREAMGRFDGAKQEFACLYGHRERPYNIWLDDAGVIQRNLTNYQKASQKIDSTAVGKLNALQGQRPMSLVVQKATRTALVSTIHSDLWKVEPALLARVDEAIAEYNAVRAPFYPLNPVQRLGYLDEEDEIRCAVTLGDYFRAGETYAISTSTRKVVRPGTKMSMTGEKQVTELSGLELFITITDRQRGHHTFVHHVDRPGEYEHTLEMLIQHFHIPDVPDVAQLQPEKYERNLARLADLEELINQNRAHLAGKVGAASPSRLAAPLSYSPAPASSALGGSIASKIQRAWIPFHFRKYQKEDIARSALHDGLVFAWDTGLGKTAAIFGWSWLHHPHARTVLIVAPAGLHEQIMKDAQDLFGITVKRLYSEWDFRQDRVLQSIAMARLNGKPHPLQDAQRPMYWITSYIDLGFSGADEWTPKTDEEGELVVGHRLERERAKILGWLPEHDQGIGEEVVMPHDTVRCLHKPSLATLVRDLFDGAALDEAVAIKSDESYRSLGVRRLRPRFRLVLTATPIKNHLDDIFWLTQWATGGHAEPTARWPYENTTAAKERFANEHMMMERNITAEQNALKSGGKFRSVKKRIPQLCNVHHLWKLLGPCIVRRRKADTEEDMVAKKIVPIRTIPGTVQQSVYAYHLKNAPTVTKTGKEMNDLSAIGAQLQCLRTAALCPDSENLRGAHGLPHAQARSWSDFNPKTAATLKLVHDIIQTGEQVVIMSPFQHFSRALYARLRSAGVSVCLLDGDTAPLKRGKTAAEFKEHRYSVLIGGLDSMGAGYSFENASHMILPSLSWAFDANEQAINRVHRLNSPKDVTIYTMVVAGTIDEKLADIFLEKGDCSSLALDGRLFADDKKEINLFELLREAVANFRADAETISELAVEKEWPALRARLAIAEQAFRQWHPPISSRNPVTRESIRVSPEKLAAELTAMTMAVAEVEDRAKLAAEKPPVSATLKAAARNLMDI